MNKRNYIIYDLIFKSIINIITKNNIYAFELSSITSDDEYALIKAIKNNFKYVNNLLCFYHLKENMLKTSIS